MTSSDEDLPTTPEPALDEIRHRPRSRTPGFAVLFCAEAPERAGAFIAVPEAVGGKPHIFGRGGARSSDEAPRLFATLQQPGHNSKLPPFENASLSRVQLEIARAPDGIRLQNVGKCPLSINGQRTDHGVARHGDVVEIGRQLVLLCTERFETMTDEASHATHAHGEPDEDGIVGESPATWKLRQEIRFISAREGHVLILGSSGTGKELVAAAIHRLSRAGKPWVARNAATLPQTLIDAELFGNAKAYPNPGMPERKGLIGAADQGSLFLDEFAELPQPAQTHLLRVLDVGEYQRLGEATARRSNFRLVAATNRPVTDLRADVLARFAFRIAIPDLSTRPEDIPLLARHWLRMMTKSDTALSKRFAPNGEPQFTPDFVTSLVKLPLPSNARELRNLLWEAICASEDGILRLSGPRPNEPANTGEPEPELTVSQLQAALEANQGSLEKTWRALGLRSRFALMRLMKKNSVQIHRQPKRS